MMRFRIQDDVLSARLHDQPNADAPASPGIVRGTDLLEKLADAAEPGWWRVRVVTPGAPQREGFIETILLTEGEEDERPLLTEAEGSEPSKVINLRKRPMADIKFVDLQNKVTDIGPIHFLRAEWKNAKSRFVLIRYSIDGKEEPFGLRLDLDKMAIMDDVGDDDTSRAVRACARDIWNVVVAAR